MRKLTMIGLWFQGVQHTAFVMAEIGTDGKARISSEEYREAFRDVFDIMPQGATFSRS